MQSSPLDLIYGILPPCKLGLPSSGMLLSGD